MEHHFDEKRTGVVRGVEVSPRMPSEILEKRSIEGDYVTVRFATTTIDDAKVVVRLHLEAKHPKVPGDVRIFDLSHILAEGYRRHPPTVEQIVDSGLSLESRLDALKTVAVTLAGVREPLPPIHEAVYGSQTIRSLDGLEPTFAIKSVILTEFSDILRGYTRRAVTVVKNEEPWVQFHITERDEALCHASMVIMPSGLELPLVDRSGHSVSEATLDSALHDFTHLLQKVRYAPELCALETIAQELTERIGRNPDAPPALKRRNFGHEVVLAARDGVLWAKDPAIIASRRGVRPPPSNDFQARELPDGRFLWARHRPRPFSSDVALVGDSLEGARYELTFHFPPQMHQRVARLFAKIVNGARWPQFREMTDLLQSNPRTGLGIALSRGTDSYPSAVNALIRELSHALPEGSVERGLLPEDKEHLDPYLSDFVSEFVKGRSPFFVTIEAEDPSARWRVQAFLDRDLNGTVFAVNALGGSIVVSDNHLVGSPDFRRIQLMRFFTMLADDSARLTHNPNYTTGLSEARRNLPERSWEDAFGYAAALHGAALAREALTKEGLLSPERNARDIRWHTRKVREGVWAVSLIDESARGSWSPFMITITGSPYGVVEIAYSRGVRGPLGGLWGRRVRPSSGGGLSDDEISNVVRVIGRGLQGKLGMPEREAFATISPVIHATLLSSLRDLDPDRERRDLLRRVWNFLKNIW